MKTRKNILGTRVRLEEFDHCALPSSVFPLRGTVVRRLRAEGGADNWCLVRLDQPLEYQKKIGEPYQFTLVNHDTVLVRSRWEGHEVGEREETSVFLLLPPADLDTGDGAVDTDACDHVAWAMCFTEGVEGSHAMVGPSNPQSPPPLSRLTAIVAILAALYVPQSWYFLMDYPWSDYRLHWLRFFPGLPVFCPVAMLFHPSEIAMAAGIWATTALVAAALFILSRKSRRAFWIALVIVCLWSTVSGVVAYAMFRA